MLEGEEAETALRILREDGVRAFDQYETLLNDQEGDGFDPNRKGLARELARMTLPLSAYTQWYWKTDLHNLFHFIRLRADAHAQYEIRVYADAIAELAKAWVPLAYEAFEDYRASGAHLSGPALEAVKRMLAGEEVTQETSGLSAGEWRELTGALGR